MTDNATRGGITYSFALSQNCWLMCTRYSQECVYF